MIRGRFECPSIAVTWCERRLIRVNGGYCKFFVKAGDLIQGNGWTKKPSGMRDARG